MTNDSPAEPSAAVSGPASSLVRTIHPSQRVGWDIFVFLVIFATAFEIPYDWFVGWESRAVATTLDLVFMVVFGADMVLNAVTLREREAAGLWGWRHVAGLLNPRWAPPRHGADGIDVEVVREPRAIALEYFRSPWFLVDFLSTVPWGLVAAQVAVLGGLRTLRLLRLARLFRFMRLTRAVVVFERIRRATPDLPSMGRLVFMLTVTPWLAHLHACLFYFFQHEVDPTVTYATALNDIFAVFATADGIQGELAAGAFWVGISAVLCSILFISAVTGSLAAVFTGLDLGRPPDTRVLSTDHTLILGWNPTVFSVIEQLCAGDEDGESGDIVLLSARPPADIWLDLEAYGGAVEGGRLTPVQGSITSPHTLFELAVGRARQVLILGDAPPEGGGADPAGPDDPDTLLGAQVLKALLACGQALMRYHPDEPERWWRLLRRPTPTVRVIAAAGSPELVRDLRGGVPARFRARMDVSVVDVDGFVTRCMAQIVHEPVMAPVFEELFSYVDPDGGESVEVYTVPVGGHLAGRCFDELRFWSETAVPIGYLVESDEDGGAPDPGAAGIPGTGSCVLNPRAGSPAGRRELRADDRLVVLASGREAAALPPTGRPPPDPRGEFRPPPAPTESRCVLVLGAGVQARRICRLLPAYLPSGSEVVTELDGLEEAAGVWFSRFPGWDSEAGRRLRDSGEAGEGPPWDTVVIVNDHGSREAHDARVLLSLARLHSRGGGQRPFDVVTTLFDPQNRELAGAYGSLAAIISSAIASNYLVQLGSDGARGRVFGELLSASGSELYAYGADRYAGPGEERLSFDLVAARAARLGEVAVGYLVPAGEDAPARRVLCPAGAARTEARIDPRRDRVVVVAEEPLHRRQDLPPGG